MEPCSKCFSVDVVRDRTISSLSDESSSSESTPNLLPLWKQELIRKRRLNDGLGICNDCSVRRRAPAGVSSETGNQVEHRLQFPKKGLVATLQTVYEPPPERAVEGRKLLKARPAPSSSPSIESGMLARPWQAGSLHGSEPASSPPPISKSPPQLGAGVVHSSADGLSSSQSRSLSGRSPAPFPDVPVSRSNVAATSKPTNGSHGAEPSQLNHYQSLSKPRRRLSEPNRDSVITSTTMVDETRSKSSGASQTKDAVDNRVKISSKTLSSLKGMSGNRENYEDEELQYGPGIVNKLKSRYLSRTLRERSNESRRPSLRRAASLEDWLDKDSLQAPQHKGKSSPSDESSQVVVRTATSKSKSERPVSLNLVPQPEQPKPPTNVSKVRDLKKTRSVDCVSQPAWRSVSVSDLMVPSIQQQQQQQPQSPAQKLSTARSPTHPTTPTSPKTPVHLLLSKDAIVIVDKNASPEAKTERKSSLNTTSTTPTVVSSVPRGRRSLPANSRYKVEDAELPPPDTVRQVKRLFESGSSSRKLLNNRRSQSAGPGLNRTPLSVANQTTDKFSVIRMNQTNLDNSKSASSVASRESDFPPRIGKLVADSKPVVITKPSPIRQKPPVLSPKPVVAVDKTRVVPTVLSGPAPFKPTATISKPITTPSVAPDLPVDKAADAKDSTDDSGHGVKTISKTALDNIHKESISIKFNFEEKKEDKALTEKPVLASVQSKQVGIIRPQVKSPTILPEKQVIFDNPASQAQSKTVDVLIKKDDVVPPPTNVPKTSSPVEKTPPITSKTTSSSIPATQTVDRAIEIQIVPKQSNLPAESVLESGVRSTSPVVPVPTSSASKTLAKDKKAVETEPPKVAKSPISEKVNNSATTANSTAVISSSSPSSNAGREQKAKQWHVNQSETTTVFNFINDNKNTDHIRNDGGSTGKLVYQPNDSGITKLPDYDPGESSDFIDDLDILKRPPSPCNVDFEGANVVVGKSLIRRAAKKQKLNLTFNDEMTKLYEYPSEVSLLEDAEDARLVTVRHVEHYSADVSVQKLTPNLKGGLSSYTPSKVHIESTFELGVSRSSALDSETPISPNPANQVGSGLHFIKPAEEKTTWSAETTSDLLF